MGILCPAILPAVQGFREPKPQKQLPSWQIEAIKHGCPKGMDWNAQEGCHEND